MLKMTRHTIPMGKASLTRYKGMSKEEIGNSWFWYALIQVNIPAQANQTPAINEVIEDKIMRIALPRALSLSSNTSTLTCWFRLRSTPVDRNENHTIIQQLNSSRNP